MINVAGIIKLAMESLPMSDLNEENYQGFLHEIKHMATDIQNIKEHLENLSYEERIIRIEERMNILLLENAKLKLLLEDICHEMSKERTPNTKTRRKS